LKRCSSNFGPRVPKGPPISQELFKVCLCPCAVLTSKPGRFDERNVVLDYSFIGPHEMDSSDQWEVASGESALESSITPAITGGCFRRRPICRCAENDLGLKQRTQTLITKVSQLSLNNSNFTKRKVT
jgi:hypothetical protein